MKSLEFIKEKLVFNNPNTPVEIFCKGQYKDYHIRGQAVELSYYIYDAKLNDYVYTIYRLILLVLVNDKYQRELGKDIGFLSHFGIFFGNTKKEFLNMRNDYDLSWAKEIKKQDKQPLREIIESIKKDRNPTLMISMNKVNIMENTYLNECIKAKKDIILLSMDIYLNRVKSPKDGHLITNYPYPKRIFPLPAFYFSRKSKFEDEDVLDWFNDLFRTVYFRFDYNYLNEKEYNRILGDIGNLSYEWIKRKKLSGRFLKSLNRLNKSIGDRTDHFNDFCYKFLDDLVDDLITHKQIARCQFCGDFFKYRQGKKYCSPQYEHKDCGKKARNRKFYAKHRNKILQKARKSTKELRALYKERGIKK